MQKRSETLACMLSVLSCVLILYYISFTLLYNTGYNDSSKYASAFPPTVSLSPPSFILKWGSWGSGDGEFSNPSSIITDQSGNVYVGDFYNHRVQKFDSQGNFITKWGTYGSGDGQFNDTSGITTDPSGNVYVVDDYNYRVQKFDSSGNFILKWGSNGTDDGQFSSPTDITTDSSDNVYVTEWGNERVQKFGNP